MTAVLCCAAGGYTALALGENCDWLSATGSEAAGFMSSLLVVVCVSRTQVTDVDTDDGKRAWLGKWMGGGKSRFLVEEDGSGEWKLSVVVSGTLHVQPSNRGRTLVPKATERGRLDWPSACPSTVMGGR